MKREIVKSLAASGKIQSDPAKLDTLKLLDAVSIEAKAAAEETEPTQPEE